MKVAVVTGTSQGLGREIVLKLIDTGWFVYGLSRSASDITDENYKHLCVDISDSKDLISVIASINKKVDLLINNAAAFEMKPFVLTRLESIDRIINTNVKGTIYTTKLILNLMSAGSKIIFINSVAGLEELENQSLYCASKHALTAFAGVIGKELQPHRINVISIHPGGINTSLWNKENPYPCGEPESALSLETITSLIDFLSKTPNTVEYKTIKLFPNVEWHN